MDINKDKVGIPLAVLTECYIIKKKYIERDVH